MKIIDHGKENKANLNFYIVEIMLCMLILSAINIGILSIFDEIVACISIGIIIISFLNSKLKKNVAIIALFILAIFIDGILSNAFSGINRSISDILIDAIITAKPFLIFAAILQISDKKSLNKLRVKLELFIKLFILVAVMYFFLNQLGIVDMTQASWNGIRDYSFIFQYPASFAIVLLALMGFILDTKVSIWKQPFVLISILLVISTLKAQSMFFLFTFIGLNFFLKIRKKIKFSHLIIVIITGVGIVAPAINNYFNTTSYSPRKLMIENGIKLFVEYFPFGSGFATFGSAMASKAYSPIYSNLGYSMLYGMGPNDTLSFLSDNFVSAIIAQLGFLGNLVFIILCIYILMLMIRYSMNSLKRVYVISMFISLIAINVASSFFSSSPGALLMCVLAIVVNSNFENSTYERKKT